MKDHPQAFDDDFKNRALECLDMANVSQNAALDRIVLLARTICATPIAFLQLVEAGGYRIKAASGIGVGSTDPGAPFWGYTIQQDDLLVVQDTHADRRFRHKSVVTDDPWIRFYAGVPVRVQDGDTIGTLCVMDRRPRDLDETQRAWLRFFAEMVEDKLVGTRRRRPTNANADHASGDDDTPLDETDAAVLLRSAASLAGLGYWIWDHATDRLVYASQEAADILGLSRADYIIEFGHPDRMFAWFHPDDRDHYRHIWFDKARKGCPYETEVRVLRQDGTVRACREVGAPVHDSRGYLRHTVGTFQDITQEKQREHDLAERLRQQSAAADLGSRVLALDDPEDIIRLVLDRAGEALSASTAVFCQIGPDGSPHRCVVRSLLDATGPSAVPAPECVEVQAAGAPQGSTIRFRSDQQASVLAGDGPVEGIVAPVHGARMPSGFLAFYNHAAAFADHVNPFLKAVSNTLAAALDRLASESARQDTIDQLTEIANAVPGMIFRRWHHPDGAITYDYLSKRCADIFGVNASLEETTPDTLLARVHPEDRDYVSRTLFKITPDAAPGEIEYRVYGPDDALRWVRTTFTVTTFADGRVRVDGVDLDVTDRRLAEDRAEYTRLYDPTTDLPNRVLVEQRLEEAISSAAYTGRNVGVVMLDIDGFSRINSVYGRSVGDQLLREVGRWLQQDAWPRDTIGRTGGDQFIVIFHALRDSADAHRIVGKLFRALSRTFSVTDADSMEVIRPTACIGFALYPRDATDGETLLDAADSALANARQQGPASYAFYTHAFTRETKRFLQTERELEGAIARDEFELHYQPQVAAGTYAITGVEALVRWNHPDRGLLSPGSFIDVAEKSGLIREITSRVVRQACAMVASWRADGRGPGRVAINLSGHDIASDALVTNITEALQTFDLPGAALEVELTETTVVTDLQRAADAMQRLADHGVGVAIDDFGTGYSSLKYLTHLPFDTLKIDRSFTSTIGMDEADDRVVRMIVGLAQGLDKRVVAEGVEYGDQAKVLAALGVDELQGFAFAPPLDAEDVADFFQRGPLTPVS